MQKSKEQGIYSQELHEIINKNPVGMFIRAIVVFLSVIIIVVVLMVAVRYKEVVRGDFLFASEEIQHTRNDEPASCDFYGTVFIAPHDIQKVKRGQAVLARFFDPISKKSFRLRVIITVVPTDITGEAKYPVEVCFKETGALMKLGSGPLKKGMTGTVEIVTGEMSILQTLAGSFHNSVSGK
ncbi:MAG TPA: hypothetical protein VHN59_04925 [Chitinophagaceae bacterium]|nr:hypothetical protein [Chitinophagaceae bacterium]